jgi:peroxiredoxin
MRAKAILFSLAVSLGVSLLPACKKGSPTSPDSPEIKFKGTISQGNQRLAGIKVFLSWGSSQARETNANGEFEFSGFTGNQFIITPSLQGVGFSPSNYVLAFQSRNDLNFTAQAPSFGSIIDQVAADFSARNQSGQNVSLYAHFGKVILIDFSANWCGFCRDEAGHLEKVFQDYKDRDFEVITLLISGSPADWASFYKLTFPVLDDNSERLWSIYGEDYLPLNILLDRNMTIRYKESGYDESTITNTIKKYL